MDEHKEVEGSVKEYHSPHKLKKKNEINVGTYVLIGLAVLILVFAVGQSFQVGHIQKSFFGGSIATGVAVRGYSAPQTQSAQSAPEMVGGC